MAEINDLIVDAFLLAHDGDTRAYPGRRELVRDSLAAVSVLLRAQWEAEHQCAAGEVVAAARAWAPSALSRTDSGKKERLMEAVRKLDAKGAGDG